MCDQGELNHLDAKIVRMYAHFNKVMPPQSPVIQCPEHCAKLRMQNGQCVTYRKSVFDPQCKICIQIKRLIKMNDKLFAILKSVQLEAINA